MAQYMSNLPPGCTNQDIEIAAGALVYCDGCGKLFDPHDDLKNNTCPRCQHADGDAPDD